MKNVNTVPESVRAAVRNNGGGHWNHSFFWESMGPKGAASRRASSPTASQVGVRRFF